HAADLPDALGVSLKDTLPTFNQVPRWWWCVKVWQSLLIVGAVAGTVWVALLVSFGLFEVADSPSALVGDATLLPYVLVLVACMFGMGALTSAACRNVVALSAARHGERIELRMRESIAAVAAGKVLEPVAQELAAYAEFRETVESARGLSPESRSVSQRSRRSGTVGSAGFTGNPRTPRRSSWTKHSPPWSAGSRPSPTTR
ncbi:MAG: hypothetical protein ABIS86_17395, partial [Streptosporangiaceae bacterium]